MEIVDKQNGEGRIADAIEQLGKKYPERDSVDKAYDNDSDTVLLPPGALRRLARLHARMEGAEAVAQIASNAAQETRVALQAALNEVCEEEGLDTANAGDTPVDIDWRRGRVRLRRPDPAARLPL